MVVRWIIRCSTGRSHSQAGRLTMSRILALLHLGSTDITNWDHFCAGQSQEYATYLYKFSYELVVSFWLLVMKISWFSEMQSTVEWFYQCHFSVLSYIAKITRLKPAIESLAWADLQRWGLGFCIDIESWTTAIRGCCFWLHQLLPFHTILCKKHFSCKIFTYVDSSCVVWFYLQNLKYLAWKWLQSYIKIYKHVSVFTVGNVVTVMFMCTNSMFKVYNSVTTHVFMNEHTSLNMSDNSEFWSKKKNWLNQNTMWINYNYDLRPTKFWQKIIIQLSSKTLWAKLFMFCSSLTTITYPRSHQPNSVWLFCTSRVLIFFCMGSSSLYLFLIDFVMFYSRQKYFYLHTSLV